MLRMRTLTKLMKSTQQDFISLWELHNLEHGHRGHAGLVWLFVLSLSFVVIIKEKTFGYLWLKKDAEF